MPSVSRSMALTRTAPCILVLTAVAACGRTTVDDTQTVLVAAADDQSLQQLQQRTEATTIREWSSTGAAVLQMRASEIDELRTAKMMHFDISAGLQLDVLPSQNLQNDPLSASQSAVLATLTRGLEPSQFQVTGERPFDLTRQILTEQNLPLGLPMPGRPSVKVLSATVATEDGMLVWNAELEDGGRATLVSDPEGMSGLIRGPSETFIIRSLGGGRQVIIPEDPTRFRDHPPPVERPAAPPPKNQPPTTCADPAGQIRVLFAHSETATQADPGILKTIKVAIDETNKTFVNSKAPLEIVFAGALKVNYVEDTSLPYQRHYAVLMDRSDGIADALPKARDAADADVVVLLVDDTRWCGESGRIRPPADEAYAVTSTSCASVHWSLAHELGHLAGGRHDDDPATTPYAFGHGHVDSSNRFRTIMATERRCSNCARIPYWSDPKITYKAAPTGVAGVSEESRVLAAEARTMAAYRCGAGGTD